MSYTNYDESQKDVVSTITPVLLEWIRLVKNELNHVNVVYEPSLDYQASVEEFRKKNNMFDKEPEFALPLLAFNRTALKQMESSSPRHAHKYAKIEDELDTNKYKLYGVTEAVFDINFTYFVNNLSDLETFEITYNTERGLTGIRNFDINVPEFNADVNYKTRWKMELENLEHNTGDSQYTAISGSLSIYGFFFNYETTGGKILDINLYIDNETTNKNIETIEINS